MIFQLQIMETHLLPSHLGTRVATQITQVLVRCSFDTTATCIRLPMQHLFSCMLFLKDQIMWVNPRCSRGQYTANLECKSCVGKFLEYVILQKPLVRIINRNCWRPSQLRYANMCTSKCVHEHVEAHMHAHNLTQ